MLSLYKFYRKISSLPETFFKCKAKIHQQNINENFYLIFKFNSTKGQRKEMLRGLYTQIYLLIHIQSDFASNRHFQSFDNFSFHLGKKEAKGNIIRTYMYQFIKFFQTSFDQFLYAHSLAQNFNRFIFFYTLTYWLN